MRTPVMWLLFDGRACGHQDGMIPDETVILGTCDSEEDARDSAQDHGACACFSFVGKGKDDKGVNLIGEPQWVFDYTPETGFKEII